MVIEVDKGPVLTAENGIIRLADDTVIRTHPPTPAGFDPLHASDADLASYGYPLRPTDPRGGQDLSEVLGGILPPAERPHPQAVHCPPNRGRSRDKSIRLSKGR